MRRFRMRQGVGKDMRRGPGKAIIDGETVEYPPGQRFTIKPGDVVFADRLEDLGAGKDKYDAVDPELPSPPITSGLRVVPRGAGGWYDVINSETGEPINDTALRLEEASELATKGLETTEDAPSTTPDGDGDGQTDPSSTGNGGGEGGGSEAE